MSETREQATVENIGSELRVLKKNDTPRYESGDSKGCNTTAKGL
jgi:hypothetical protein